MDLYENEKRARARNTLRDRRSIVERNENGGREFGIRLLKIDSYLRGEGGGGRRVFFSFA